MFITLIFGWLTLETIWSIFSQQDNYGCTTHLKLKAVLIRCYKVFYQKGLNVIKLFVLMQQRCDIILLHLCIHYHKDESDSSSPAYSHYTIFLNVVILEYNGVLYDILTYFYPNCNGTSMFSQWYKYFPLGQFCGSHLWLWCKTPKNKHLIIAFEMSLAL